MKKFFGIHLLLCLALLLEMLGMPVSATQTGTSPQETLPAAGDTAFGTATVTSGCRTLDGMVPLGGSTAFLKSAQAAFIYEQNTGTVMYAYNPDITLSPGALSKL